MKELAEGAIPLLLIFLLLIFVMVATAQVHAMCEYQNEVARRKLVAAACFGVVLVAFFGLKLLSAKGYDMLGSFMAFAGLVLMAAGFLAFASRVEFSNRPERNIWWSGFLQGLIVSFFIVIFTTFIISLMQQSSVHL